jgi:hypothetical protein
MAYGCLMECIPLASDAVNTHREKPKVLPIAREIEISMDMIILLFRTVGLIERYLKHSMNFSKNQLIRVKFERKVKLFIKVVEQKSKQWMLMEMKYPIMLVQVVIQVLSNIVSLIINTNIKLNKTIVIFEKIFIILVSFLPFV